MFKDRNKQVNEKKEVRSEVQIIDSLSRLERLKSDADQAVSNVRIVGDHSENARRVKEEINRDGMQHRLQSEAYNSSKRNAAISMRWASLYEKNIPQDLLRDIQSQQEACEKVIQSKDRLIQEFVQELKAKDEEYVKSLKRQADQIDELLNRMHEQTTTLVSAYEREYEEIEAAYNQERKELLESSAKELEDLTEQMRVKEMEYVKKRLERVSENEEKLDQLREQEMENFAIKQKELETIVQELEQQIDAARGIYLLNSEKLEYNFLVLSERVEENKAAIRHNKGKISRLQDLLSGIKTRYAKTDKKYRQINSENTDQYKKLTEQYKDLQLKFQYFEKADTQKFRDIWEMNEQTVLELADRVLKIDKIIHEQQLGLEWVPPEENYFVSPIGQGLNMTMNSNIDASMIAESAMFSSMAGALPGEDGMQNAPRISAETTKKVLELLCDSAGFLVEKKVLQLLDRLPHDEQNLLKADSILRSIGVETPEEIAKMIPYFLKTTSNPGSPATPQESITLVSANEVITALKTFVEDHQRSMSLQHTHKQQKILNAEERARQRQRQEERDYWARMKNALTEDGHRLWMALERAMTKYNTVLTERAKLLDETEAIRTQNQELKLLLNKYLSQKINEELYVPPNVFLNSNSH